MILFYYLFLLSSSLLTLYSCHVCWFNYVGMKRAQTEAWAKKHVYRKYIIYAYDVTWVLGRPVLYFISFLSAFSKNEFKKVDRTCRIPVWARRRVKFTETTLTRKVRVILWIKIPGHLKILGHDAIVEIAAKCRQKRNACAVKNWSQFDISIYMITKNRQLAILFQKNLVSYIPCFPKLLFEISL